MWGKSDKSCTLSQIKPAFILASIFGLNWFEIYHHHKCSETDKNDNTKITRNCEVRSKVWGIGSIFSVFLFVISVFVTWFISLNVWDLIGTFFHGVELVTFSLYLAAYYWQTPPLLLIARFTFFKIPAIWERLQIVAFQLKMIHGPESLQKCRLRILSAGFSALIIVQSATYMGFFQYVIRHLCNLMEKQEIGCYYDFMQSFGVNITAASFLLICACPQVISLLFFLNCYVVKRLLDQLGQKLRHVLEQEILVRAEYEDKSSKIMSLRVLYAELVDIVTQIGHCFGIQLIIVWLTSIVSLTVSAYIMFTDTTTGFDEFEGGADEAGSPLLVFLGCQLYFAFFTLALILIGGSMVKDSGKEIHKTIDRAKCSSLAIASSESQFQIGLFKNAGKTVISVYGITTVEMKLLAAVAANVITYFLILVQLKISFELTVGANRSNQNQTNKLV